MEEFPFSEEQFFCLVHNNAMLGLLVCSVVMVFNNIWQLMKNEDLRSLLQIVEGDPLTDLNIQ